MKKKIEFSCVGQRDIKLRKRNKQNSNRKKNPEEEPRKFYLKTCLNFFYARLKSHWANVP